MLVAQFLFCLIVLQELQVDNQNQDWVLLADILEYEMVPFYKDWENILSKLENPH